MEKTEMLKAFLELSCRKQEVGVDAEAGKAGVQGWGESLGLVSELASRAGADKYKLFPSKLFFFL